MSFNETAMTVIDKRKKLIQIIHVAKHQLGMDEMTYRALLERVAHKNSTTKMNIGELENVLLDLTKKGFKLQSNVLAQKTKRYVKRNNASSNKIERGSNISYKMLAVWESMHMQGIVRDGSEAALNTFICKSVNRDFGRKTGILYMSYKHLPDDLASKALEQLKQWQKRMQ